MPSDIVSRTFANAARNRLAVLKMIRTSLAAAGGTIELRSPFVMQWPDGRKLGFTQVAANGSGDALVNPAFAEFALLSLLSLADLQQIVHQLPDSVVPKTIRLFRIQEEESPRGRRGRGK